MIQLKLRQFENSVSPLPELADSVVAAIARSQEFFLRQQKPEGYWVAPLEADATLESDYVLFLRLVGVDEPEKVRKAVRYIRDRQLPDGGWNIYEGGPEEINATVKAYTALKLSGALLDEPALVRARQAIARMGGIAGLNTYTRIYLHLIGQYPAEGIPAIPPEIVLAPHWSFFNLYEISSWSRAITMPLAVVCARFPRTSVPEELGIGELFPEGIKISDLRLPWSPEIVSWRNVFLLADRAFKLLERFHLTPLRGIALRRAEKWMLERFEHSRGLATIYPAMLNSILALLALGYPLGHVQVRRAIGEFEKLIRDHGDRLQFQPCESPVWDTGLAMLALLESGLNPGHPALVRAADWLLDRQTTRPGDWSVKNPKTPPGGWYFQHANEFYPDLDDTCVVLMVLRRVLHPDAERCRRAQERGLRWLFDMQCRSGGWASFDRDNTRMIFAKIPFADHNAMLDPPTADITGRILEMLSHFGLTRKSPEVERPVRFLKSEQEPDGSWYGRWGVNYIYGTWQVLKGLYAVGEDMSQDYVQRAAAWLRSHQNADGGWGESCLSYDDSSQRGVGPSTPSQTAWAVMGLLSAGDRSSPSLLGGVRHLVANQMPGGDWEERAFTGTGFPRVFYLRYDYYRNYFPLFALGMYNRLAGRNSGIPVSGHGVTGLKSQSIG